MMSYDMFPFKNVVDNPPESLKISFLLEPLETVQNFEYRHVCFTILVSICADFHRNL